MDKLAQPKQPSLGEEPAVDSTDGPNRSTRRPSLKRRVKSQGDIPEPGFPLLPRRRRTGPASATIGRSAEERREATRRTLPPGVPTRSAWPLKDDGEGTAARQDGRGTEKLPGGVGGDGNGSSRSTANISAIEAMLEEGGGDAYLPARARDLPEAVAILGPPRPGSSVDGEHEQGHASRKAHPRGTRKKTKGSGCEGERNNARRYDDQTSESTNSLDAPREKQLAGGDLEPTFNDGRAGRASSGASSQAGRGDGTVERFLHPWQRALEASKRAITSRAEEHEAALLREKRRRSEARRAAAASKDCQKARKRVAARLGRHKQRRHRNRRSAANGDNAERDREQPQRLGFDREGTRFSTEGQRTNSPERLDDIGYAHRGDESGGHDDCLLQMRDALGWARRTLTALVQRLRDRGVAVDNSAPADGERTAKDREVVRVVNKLGRRLAAFEDEGVTFGVETAAAAAAAATAEPKEPAASDANSSLSLLRSRCETACESFEIEFGRMIDELIATAKSHPSNPNLQLSRFEDDSDGASPLIAAGSQSDDPISRSSGGTRRSADPPLAAPAATRSRRTAGTASFGLCSSCSVLPVARRCLDCEGDQADRDRCSSCFVREHREAPRHLHRFLRISGGSGGFGGDGSGGGGDHAEPKQLLLGGQGGHDTSAGNSETQGNSSGVGARCSRCGDLAAARRCRECRVDTCAACHFLAHRSPSRRSHVTEFVGETAVALQETLQSRNRRQSVEAARTAASGPSGNGDGDGEEEEEGASRDGGPGTAVVEPAVFGEDAAQSLAQVRRTIDAPVVRPRSQASRERGSNLHGRDGSSAECGEEEDLSDEADSGGTGLEAGCSYGNGSAGAFGGGRHVEAAGNDGSGSAFDDHIDHGGGRHADGSFEVTGDIVRGERGAAVTAVVSDSADDFDDSGRSEKREHKDADRRHQGGRRRVGGAKYALEVLEGIHEEDEEEKEGGAGSSVCSSLDDDTDDEGMVRNSQHFSRTNPAIILDVYLTRVLALVNAFLHFQRLPYRSPCFLRKATKARGHVTARYMTRGAVLASCNCFPSPSPCPDSFLVSESNRPTG